jgi:hypothetical protein
LTLFGFIAGLKVFIFLLKIASIPAVVKVVPPKVPFWGVAAGVALVSHFVGQAIFVGSKRDHDLQNLLDSTTLPLWKNKSNVVSI